MIIAIKFPSNLIHYAEDERNINAHSYNSFHFSLFNTPLTINPNRWINQCWIDNCSIIHTTSLINRIVQQNIYSTSLFRTLMNRLGLVNRIFKIPIIPIGNIVNKSEIGIVRCKEVYSDSFSRALMSRLGRINRIFKITVIPIKDYSAKIEKKQTNLEFMEYRILHHMFLTFYSTCVHFTMFSDCK